MTYEVTGEGTIEISYLARSGSGSATVVKDAALPWKKTVRVLSARTRPVAIVLGEGDGQAACTLAVRGAHVQRTIASGTYCRVTCSGRRCPPATP
ncbi:MmpS family transport accessory protein [Streptomyces sp. NPDC057539]|uniref:MmpS family transport accessory protein n=1 Tax=Streptomyces sp. NPDC057539 TaxID=3346159 RepID=UPI0036A9C4A2